MELTPPAARLHQSSAFLTVFVAPDRIRQFASFFAETTLRDMGCDEPRDPARRQQKRRNNQIIWSALQISMTLRQSKLTEKGWDFWLVSGKFLTSDRRSKMRQLGRCAL
ncbi:MAG TPA: hypothetical protein VL492_01390 [Methylovirgula sp.]|jgi:hypothetical protein|nr:hypothetical protein [Methylovirgula sp.]